MKIEIRNDKVIIDGYVNAVGRDSRPLMPRSPLFPDKCVEQVVPGSFKKSLENRSNVDLLINHDKNRRLGSTEGGELTLNEDSIGLRAHAVITDPAAIEKARNGEFVGWSFGMFVNGEEKEERAGNIPRRKVTDLDLYEVSLIDRTMQPCYAGTSVECRADGETVSETRSFEDTAEIVNNVVPPDFSEFEKKLADLRAQSDISDAEMRLAELRYNPYHDPTNGRFTTADGGGMGAVLHVPMGNKGKGEYVFAKEYNGTDNADFAERNSKFIKINNRKRKHYDRLLEDGDITTQEYNELVSELPDNIRENGSYTMRDKDNNVIKSTGTLFDYNGRKYGYNHIGNNDFVTDIETSTFLPLKKYNPSFGEVRDELVDVIKTAEIVNFVAQHNRAAIYNNSDKKVFKRAGELRYNPYHDPTNGRFTTADGGGMGAFLHVPMGSKGKGSYVISSENFTKSDKKYTSEDKTFTDEGVQYVVGIHNFKRTPSIDKGQVLVAGTDNNGNLMLKAAKPIERLNDVATESKSLFSLRHGVTNFTTLDKEPTGQPRHGGKTSYLDFLETNNPKVGDIQSFGIDWDNVKSVKGETYGVRDYIKQKGFKWNGEKERWEK